MGAIVSVLPLLIIIVIILWFFVMKKPFIRKSLSLRQTKLVFVLYFAVLIIAAILSLFLPKTKATVMDDSNQSIAWESTSYMKAKQGTLSTINSNGISKSWGFPYKGKTLILASDYYDGGILVEKTDELEDRIEISFVKDWQTLGVGATSIDVSDYAPDMEVTMNADTLRFVSPGIGTIISISVSNLAFPMKQLLGESLVGNVGLSSSGSRFFYLRIPIDLEVKYPDDLYVDFVEN